MLSLVATDRKLRTQRFECTSFLGIAIPKKKTGHNQKELHLETRCNGHVLHGPTSWAWVQKQARGGMKAENPATDPSSVES